MNKRKTSESLLTCISCVCVKDIQGKIVTQNSSLNTSEKDKRKVCGESSWEGEQEKPGKQG